MNNNLSFRQAQALLTATSKLFDHSTTVLGELGGIK